MNQYTVKRLDDFVKVHNSFPDYSLEIQFGRRVGRPIFMGIRFYYDIGKPLSMLVYERDAQSYFDNFPNLQINPRFQYVDVGAGLAGFVPFL